MSSFDKFILNEEEVKDFINKNFNKQISILTELRDYGLNLLSRCIIESEKNIKGKFFQKPIKNHANILKYRTTIIYVLIS